VPSAAATAVGAEVRVRVREGVDADVPTLLPIWRDMMAAHARYSSAFALADDAERIWRRGMHDLMARTDTFVLVAAPLDAAALGFICGWVARNPAIYLEADMGVVSEIAVSSACARTGVGRALMASARAWFAAREVPHFQLATAGENVAAQRFFAALGGEALLLRYRFEV
jgi:ribosomal protein S18 acetylase RimI-like enzyme